VNHDVPAMPAIPDSRQQLLITPINGLLVFFNDTLFQNNTLPPFARLFLVFSFLVV